MTFDGRTLTTFVMFTLFAGASLLALGLPSKAAFMPLLVGVPGTILCAVQLVIDLRRDPNAPAADAKHEKRVPRRSEAEVFLWLAGFTVAILGFGFVIGGPIIVGAFIRFASRESWQSALFAAAGTFAALWGVFVWLLELSLFEGFVIEALFG